MKTIIRPNRDTMAVGYQKEVELSVRGKGKSAVVLMTLDNHDGSRILEFELRELLSALKGLELYSR